MKKEIEGKTYILQDKVEEIVKERISKHAAKSTELQNQLTALQTEYDSSVKIASTATELQNKLTELEGKLATTSNRFSKYKTISSKGITDNDVIELLEWTYEKTQKDVKKGDKKEMSDWLTWCIQNPEQAPVTIRPHLPNNSTSVKEQLSNPEPAAPPPPPEPTAIKTPVRSNNAGAVSVNPEVKDVWNSVKSLSDYETNREQIRQAWHKQFKRG